MKFKILAAKLETIGVGKQNAGNKYVLMEVIEDSMFAEQSHNRTVFIPQSLVPAWEQAIATNNFPGFDAKYVIVNDLPQFRVKRSDGTVLETIHTSMKILVRTDEAGQAIEDANSIAKGIVETLMVKVTTSSAPVAAEQAPAAPGVVPPAIA